MRYRRNSDNRLRDLEHQWQSSGDPALFHQYVLELFRTGNNPFWIRIRETMARRNTVYYDSELLENQKNWSRAVAEDPEQTYYPEPEVFLKTSQFPGGIPWWENREPFRDRVWNIFLHIPRPDGTAIDVGLGKITGYEDGDTLRCTVEGHRDRFSFDRWQENARLNRNQSRTPLEAANEAARANWSLANQFRSTGEDALLNMDVPIDWEPTDPILLSYGVQPLNEILGPDTPDDEKPYREGARMRHSPDAPITEIPDHEFYITEYLFNQFMEWLTNTTTYYGQRVLAEIDPLDPQLPTISEGKWINLYYWVALDSVREIEGSNNPNDPEYQQHRYVYNVAYRLDWRGDYNARFWRYSGDPAHVDPLDAIRTSELQFQDPSEAAHERARARAWEILQKKIAQILSVTNKYDYRVILVEGEPISVYDHTWQAGMQYPLPPLDLKKEIHFF